jgi:hypothetical protein
MARSARLPPCSATWDLEPMVVLAGPHEMRSMARSARLPPCSAAWDLEPMVVGAGPREMAPYERRWPCDRTETARLKSGPGSPTRRRLTSRQSLARMGGGLWSMRPWESVRPRLRRQGVPRSHGPAEETLNDQEVKLRLTAEGLRRARITGGAALARTGGRPPNRRTKRPTAPRCRCFASPRQRCRRRSAAGRPPERTTALGATSLGATSLGATSLTSPR